MRLTTLTTALATATLATARLSGFAAPATIAPESRFNLTLIAIPRVESTAEVAVSYGYSTNPGFPGTLGYNEQSMVLGPGSSNQPTNHTILAKAPKRANLIPDRPEGPAEGEAMYLNLAIFSLVGVDAYPFIASYNVSVEFGAENSEELVGTTTPLLVPYS